LSGSKKEAGGSKTSKNVVVSESPKTPMQFEQIKPS
jgi:hypothetical protein